MGALISFELARHLRQKYNLRPQHLFVSGHNAPQVTEYETPIHGLADEAFEREIRQLNGTSESVLADPELMALILPIIRADFALCETYVYTEDDPLDCPISVCGGLEDAYLNRDGLEAWAEQTTKTCTLHLFPGDHFYLAGQRPYLLRLLAQKLLSVRKQTGNFMSVAHQLPTTSHQP
jgi:medium-chain acyl-[acyl-carrier-protein] hydrolase